MMSASSWSARSRRRSAQRPAVRYQIALEAALRDVEHEGLPDVWGSRCPRSAGGGAASSGAGWMG